MRYVYLMHRPGTDNYKIGIARSVRYRRFMIDQDVEGQVMVITARRCPGAYSVEQRLHECFSDRRFRLNAGPNAGRTEWFHFGIVELCCFFILFNILTLRPYVEALASASLIVTIAAIKIL